MTAPTLLDTGSGYNSGGSSTINWTVPGGGTYIGDVVVAVARTRGGAVTTPTSGDGSTWTNGGEVNSTGLRIYHFWKVLTAADVTAGSFTFTGPSGSPRWTVHPFSVRDVEPSHGLLGFASAVDSSGRAYTTSFDAPSIAGFADCMLISTFTWRDLDDFVAGGSTTPAGMTSIINGGSNDSAGNGLAYRDTYLSLSAAGATGTKTLTNVSGGGGVETFEAGIGCSFLLVGTGVSFAAWSVGTIRF